MKTAWCNFCQDYTLGNHSVYYKGATKTYFWHRCNTCSFETDSFTQNSEHANNLNHHSNHPLDATVGKVKAA